jgi:hypothetical protein
MKTWFKLTAISALALLAGTARMQAASTNVVQYINCALTLLEQGPNKYPHAGLTIMATSKVKLITKDIIAVLGTATGNHFTPHARLLRVININNTSNTTIEVRDGTNRVDVTSLISITHSSTAVNVGATNSRTGIDNFATTDILRLNVSGTDPFSLRLSGLCTTRHTSISNGNTMFGVSELRGDLTGTGTDSWNVPAIVCGNVNIFGHIKEVR